MQLLGVIEFKSPSTHRSFKTDFAQPTLGLPLIFTTVITLSVMLFNINAFAAEPSASEKISSTTAQIKTLKGDIERMQSLLKKLAKKRSHATKVIERLDREVSEVHANITKEREAYAEIEEQLEALLLKDQALTEQKHVAIGHMNQQIRSRYQSPNQASQIKLLFQEENPREIDRNLQYHQYLIESQNQQIIAFNALLASIKENQIAINESKSALERRKAALDEQLAALEASLSKREVALAKIKSEQRKNKRSLSSMESQQQELTAVLDLLKLQSARAKARHPGILKKGSVTWPVDPIRISNRTALKKTKKGVLIPTRPFNPVKSVSPGTVVFSDWLRGYGWMIIVQHDNDYLSLYAQNARLKKSVGERVKAGETIALSGAPGALPDRNSGSTRKAAQISKLYFELRKAGKPVDPKLWLTKKSQ